MFKKILFIIVDVIAFLAVVFGVVAVIIAARTTPGQAPSFYGYSVLYVVSPSMEPIIPVDSVVIVKKMTEKAQVGDIIAYYSKDPSIMGQINTHRVNEIKDDGTYITKGDNNPIADNENYAVSDGDILGEVVSISPAVGNIVTLVKRKSVFLFVILLPLAMIFIWSIRSMLKIAKAEVAAEVAEIENSDDQVKKE